jgi:hypothetical protein
MRKSKSLGLVAFAAAIIVVTLLAYYSPSSFSRRGVVESSLRGLGYDFCGQYTVRPRDEVIEFRKEFHHEVACYLIINRGDGGYMIADPEAILTVKPPSNRTVYRYNILINPFSFISRLSVSDFKPYSDWGGGFLNITRGVPPPTAFNDDFYVVFSYKPEENGYPVKIELTIRMKVSEGRAPVVQPPTTVAGERPTKLAERLGIRDIKALMSHLGYELCGEFHAEDAVGKVQTVDFMVEVDPNKGKACYMLIYPPLGHKALLIVNFTYTTTLVGDEGEVFKRCPFGDCFIGARFTVASAFDILGLGRVYSSGDVQEPYAEKVDLGGAQGRQIKFFDNTPALIYFAYKIDPGKFSEPVGFQIKTHTHIEFTVIQAYYVVEGG